MNRRTRNFSTIVLVMMAVLNTPGDEIPVRLQIRPAPERAFTAVRAAFLNGDELSGNLIRLDNNTLGLRTAHGENLDLRPETLRSLTFRRPERDQILDATVTLENWRHPARVSDTEEVEALPVAGGLLIHQPVNGIMRRPLPALPDEMRIELTLRFLRPDTAYSLYLFSSERTVYNPGTLFLGIREGEILVRQRTYENIAIEFEKPLPENAGTRHAYSIYVNHKSRRLAVWLNGHLVHEGELILRHNPDTGGLWFSVSKERGAHYFLEHLRVENRPLPFPLDPEPKEAELYRITLANGDVLDARGVTIQDGTLSAVTPGGSTLPLPLSVVRAVDFPDADPAPGPEQGDVRIWLAAGGGFLTGKLLEEGAETVILQHPGAENPLTIPLREVDVRMPAAWVLPPFPER